MGSEMCIRDSVDTAPEKIFPLITAFDNKFLPSYADEITPNGVQKVIRIVGLNEFDNVSVLLSLIHI